MATPLLHLARNSRTPDLNFVLPQYGATFRLRVIGTGTGEINGRQTDDKVQFTK